jgi:hypothetical protein
MKFFINLYLYSMASIVVFGFTFLSIAGYSMHSKSSSSISFLDTNTNNQIYTAISIDYYNLNADSALG